MFAGQAVPAMVATSRVATRSVILLCAGRIEAVAQEIARCLRELGLTVRVVTPSSLASVIRNTTNPTTLVACISGPRDGSILARADRIAERRRDPHLRLLVAEVDLARPLQVVKPIFRFSTGAGGPGARTDGSVSELLPTRPFRRVRVVPLAARRLPSITIDEPTMAAPAPIARLWVTAILCVGAGVVLGMALNADPRTPRASGPDTVVEVPPPSVTAAREALAHAVDTPSPAASEIPPDSEQGAGSTLDTGAHGRRGRSHGRGAAPAPGRPLPRVWSGAPATWAAARRQCRDLETPEGENWRLPGWKDLRDLRRGGRLEPGRYWSSNGAVDDASAAYALDTRARKFVPIARSETIDYLCVRDDALALPDLRAFSGPIAVNAVRASPDDPRVTPTPDEDCDCAKDESLDPGQAARMLEAVAAPLHHPP